MQVISTRPDEFRAAVGVLDLYSVNVVALTSSACTVDRTRPMIAASDPEDRAIVLPLQGQVSLEQDGREAGLSTAEFGLYTSSQPLKIRIHRAAAPRGCRGCKFRRGGWPCRPNVSALAATPITSRDGVDLDRTARSVARLELLRRITRRIHRQLADPELSPRSIAAAEHISVGHLHRLFAEQDYTVSAWIRRLRLEHARQQLTDPGRGDGQIHRVAARWGFADHSTFTRAFRLAYGMSPQDYRAERIAAATTGASTRDSSS